MFVCIFLNTHIGVINMSVLLTLAIILAIIAVVIRRNSNVKATSVVATTSVVAADAAQSVAHTQDVCDPINCTEALVYVLMYTKTTLKAQRLDGRRARSHAANKAARARSHAAYIAGAAKRMEITMRDQQRALGRAAQKELVREAQVQGISVTKLLARKAQGAAQRAANAARKQAATHVGKTANRHVEPRGHGIISITADGHKMAVVTPANKKAQAVKPVRTYVRQAANTAPSGKQLGDAAKAKSASIHSHINASKEELERLYSILPLARQVVALGNKATRKVALYNWLSDEGHVGIRATKASIDRRDVAQELVCKAILAAEAFKKAYGIEAQDVVSQILAVKAAKVRAVAMLRNHKAEQHRLFLERQERRAAKAALKASKATTAPAAAKTVTEVADWEKYAPVNSGNKAIASKFIVARNATIAQKAAAIAAINGAQEQHVVGKCTADAAYGVAA